MGDGPRGPHATVEVLEEPIAALREHAGVSSPFRVERVLSVAAPGNGAAGRVLSESPLDVPYVKDYDALDGGSARWAERFDVRAVARGCRGLEVETQNINVAARRFYARQGCLLDAITRDAYPGLPDEVQLIWRKELIPRPAPGAGTGTT